MPGIPKAKGEIKNCLDTSCQEIAKSNWRNIHRFEIAHGEIKDSEQPEFHLILVLDKHS
jgi:hypothetical protein